MFAILYTLILTHITIICVTLFLHRSQTHRSCLFNPVISHLMRFWLWLTTGMITKQWVAIHRLHHQKTDSTDDPHSPQVYGLKKVLFGGALLYYKAAKNKDMIESLGYGTPNDWVEKHVYTPYHYVGITLLLLLNLLWFSYWGLLVWLVQMIWVPFWAAGVVNGVGHYWGYRSIMINDSSRNIFPWGILIGGEELHHNHHLDPVNPKLSRRWFELDLGYIYLKILCCCKLATIRN